MKKVIIIDNYDSFTFNLVHALEEILDQKIVVKKNDQVELEELNDFDYIILSPGPGLPDESGLLKEIISKYHGSKKILGVCLGLQAIAEVYGCQLKNLEKVYHGIQSKMHLTNNESILYSKIDDEFLAGRYHSWVIDPDTLVDDLIVTSKDDQGQIMSIEHKNDKVYAVQFHPESIMTEKGNLILENFLNLA